MWWCSAGPWQTAELWEWEPHGIQPWEKPGRARGEPQPHAVLGAALQRGLWSPGWCLAKETTATGAGVQADHGSGAPWSCLQVPTGWVQPRCLGSLPSEAVSEPGAGVCQLWLWDSWGDTPAPSQCLLEGPSVCWEPVGSSALMRLPKGSPPVPASQDPRALRNLKRHQTTATHFIIRCELSFIAFGMVLVGTPALLSLPLQGALQGLVTGSS